MEYINLPKCFTDRNRKAPDVLSYELPVDVRNRIIYTLSDSEGMVGLHEMFEYAKRKTLKKHSKLAVNPNWNISPQELPAGHFRLCPDNQALDFLEWIFQSPAYRPHSPGRENVEVDAINEIFREESVGFELSPYRIIELNHVVDGRGYGPLIQFPIVTKKSNDLMHQTTVMPCLNLLASATFKQANDEMLEAHRHFRDGDFDAAINSCGRSFESVFKIICDAKRWTYDRDKDTLSKLVDITYTNNLFPSFYVEIFKSAGTIRNKSSHGKAGAVHPPTTAEQVEHMIQTTSAHMLLLARMAKL